MELVTGKVQNIDRVNYRVQVIINNNRITDYLPLVFQYKECMKDNMLVDIGDNVVCIMVGSKGFCLGTFKGWDN